MAARVSDLEDAFADPTVRAVFASRGGWSAHELLGKVDGRHLAGHPKIVCGYSNIAALHAALGAPGGLVTYYGPSFSSLGRPHGHAYSLRQFARCIMAEGAFALPPKRRVAGPGPADTASSPNRGPWTVHPGEAEGTIVGGCLTDLNLLQGRPYMPALEGAIVFLEDDVATSPPVRAHDAHPPAGLWRCPRRRVRTPSGQYRRDTCGASRHRGWHARPAGSRGDCRSGLRPYGAAIHHPARRSRARPGRGRPALAHRHPRALTGRFHCANIVCRISRMPLRPVERSGGRCRPDLPMEAQRRRPNRHRATPCRRR